MTRTLIASILLMSASAASASSPIVYHLGDPPTAKVSYRDVDVHSQFGRMTVERRIQTAAKQVCIDASDDDGLFPAKNRYRDCYNLAVAKGVTQLEQIAGD